MEPTWTRREHAHWEQKGPSRLKLKTLVLRDNSDGAHHSSDKAYIWRRSICINSDMQNPHHKYGNHNLQKFVSDLTFVLTSCCFLGLRAKKIAYYPPENWTFKCFPTFYERVKTRPFGWLWLRRQDSLSSNLKVGGWIPRNPSCMSKCPWARHLTPNWGLCHQCVNVCVFVIGWLWGVCVRNKSSYLNNKMVSV